MMPKEPAPGPDPGADSTFRNNIKLNLLESGEEMPVHLCKLLPPRPSFPADMSEMEAALIGAHAAYWSGLVERGIAVEFGAVFEPSRVRGLAIADVADEKAAARLTDDDPVIRSGNGFR